MSHSAFEKYNDEQEKTGKKLAANPRNLAAGTLRQLNPAITKERGLKMFVFNVQQGPEEVMESHCDAMDFLSANGIPTVFHKKCTTVDEIIQAIDEIAERILMLGGTPQNQFSNYLQTANIKESGYIDNADKALNNIGETLKVLIAEERELLSLASETKDEVTVAMISDLLKGQEKTIWMLSAYAS